MSPASNLLDRLDGARQVAPDQYVARCPAHADESPSLSVRDLGDRILVHCFAACTPGEVMEAVGLTLADLFERPVEHHRKSIPGLHRWDYRALLRALRTELAVVLLAANDLHNGKVLPDADLSRLREAIGRITQAMECANDK